jgi:alanine dehydrogenase
MAGAGAGIADQEYIAAGAEIAATAERIYLRAELIVKVKEPLASERRQWCARQIIFTYLHLAPDPEQTRDLMASGVTAIAYETVTNAAGKLPLLAPMSSVAGRMAPQVAAHFLQRPEGGRGILLGGIEGVPSAKVLVLGGGVVGSGAAEMAIGMGADVTVATRSLNTLRHLSQRFGERATTITADAGAIEAPAPPRMRSAPPVAAALRPNCFGAHCRIHETGPSLSMFRSIKVAARKRTPDDTPRPTFVVDGVALLRREYARRSTENSAFALDNATRPFVLALADKDSRGADRRSASAERLNVHDGKITCRRGRCLRLPISPRAVRGEDQHADARPGLMHVKACAPFHLKCAS